MGYAFQFRVPVGQDVNGSTAFTWPSALPTPTNGVHVFDLATDFGLVDLEGIPNHDANTGWWVRALHAELQQGAAATLDVFHASYRAPGQTNNTLLMPDFKIVDTGGGDTRGCMPLRTLFPEAYVPRGAVLRFRAETFAAAAVEGPVNIYLEIEPLANDKQRARVAALCATARDRLLARGQIINSFQAIAATAAEFHAIRRRCYVSRVVYIAGATEAAGESMQIEIVRTNTVGLTTLIDATPNSVDQGREELSSDHGLVMLEAGDRLGIVRTYTAGGGPTPIENTSVMVELTPLPITSEDISF